MSKKINLVWRFTVVNRFTLEQIDEVFVLGSNYHFAELHLREIFPSQLFDIDDVCQISNSKLVVVGRSNMEYLL